MQNGVPIPDVSRPRLLWDQPWSHDWNKGILFRLSQKYLEEIKNGSRPLLASAASQSAVAEIAKHISTLKPTLVQRLIENKLKRTKSLFRIRKKALTDNDFQAQMTSKSSSDSRMDRQNSRRHLVSFISLMLDLAHTIVFTVAL